MNEEMTAVPPLGNRGETCVSDAASSQPRGGSSRPPGDPALACLLLIARLHGLAADAAQLAHELGSPFGPTEILHAAQALGLQAKALRIDLRRLASTPLPALATGRDAEGNPDYFVLLRGEGEKVLLAFPGRPPVTRTLVQLQEHWTGELILFTTRSSPSNSATSFGLAWFIPSLVKHRKLLAEVFVASFALQVFALVTPLFFQVLMDKVLVHRGFTTLNVIAVGLAVVMIFDVTLTALRSYVFSHTTSRIDVELGAKLFRHLLGLPLAYFQARRVGDSVARMRELENLRAFLTGNALTLLVDLFFSLVFIGVMLFYSGWLTLIVMLSLACYAGLCAFFTPWLRMRLREKFSRGAENQAFLVETINGIDTVKAMAAEPIWIRRWEAQLSAYIQASFASATTASLASCSISFVSKMTTLATMYAGARLAMDNQVSVGQLIAFNMLAGQVAQPVLRLTQMWTDFQQVEVSVQKLGDILNTPREAASARAVAPPLRGRISFRRVCFRYRPDGPEVLRDVTLEIAPGEVVGVVGRSGSGKSTIASLVQGMHVAGQGRVMVDGMDVCAAQLSSLRRQIGAVLQETMLFNRSIRDNIALAQPHASMEEVTRVARLAGAHDFILDLPEGYETTVGEHGSSLSGGQRQRIAIARALMADPRILIFDEATSALDYESERIVQANMQAICKGRTVIIIAHRLSAVRHADRILVMEGGRIVESDTPAALLGRDSWYRRLYRMQQA